LSRIAQYYCDDTNGITPAYYGKTVNPADKDKVLFRWRLDSGEYRVIFGDLRHETVALARLKELEAK